MVAELQSVVADLMASIRPAVDVEPMRVVDEEIDGLAVRRVVGLFYDRFNTVM